MGMLVGRLTSFLYNRLALNWRDIMGGLVKIRFKTQVFFSGENFRYQRNDHASVYLSQPRCLLLSVSKCWDSFNFAMCFESLLCFFELNAVSSCSMYVM